MPRPASMLAVLLVLAFGADGFTGPSAARRATRAQRRVGITPTAVLEEKTESGVDKVNEASKKFGGPLSAVTDSLSGVTFAALHAFDDCGVQDAAKNLRVLWTRAFLANSGVLEDDVAYELLPTSTRGVVSPGASPIWTPLLPFCDWIKARTEYLDSILDTFLGNRDNTPGAEPYQVVIIGAGYDTRSLRKQGDHVNFFEVDLPEIVEGKGRLYKKYTDAHPDRSTLPNMIGMDLDECRSSSIIERLKAAGLKPGVPTMFTFEAVLFYLEPEAVEGLFNDLFTYGDTTETVIAFTDSLKGLGVTKPFMPEVAPVFEERGFELLTHRAQWGGAVHFTSCVSTAAVAATETGTDTGHERKTELRDHMQGVLGKPTNSYAPQFSLHSGELLKKPSFRKAWYAVTFADEVKTDGKPYATRLWGEPMVLYRDSEGNVNCVRDVCPHRAAPLSMGNVVNGQLQCMYHGWSFGSEGKCEDVPTMPGMDADNKFMQKSCATNYATVQHENLIWVWGGETLEADPTLLPSTRKGEETLYVDTMLDYNVDWAYIVENNLDSPHIYWLHDGSIPPLDSLGFNRDNVDRFSLRRFKDEIGVGHVGKTADKSTTKIVRFDAPNIVRHCGVSGFSEEFHIVPIAPHRTRVLLRQHFPKGPILAGVARDPILMSSFKLLMRWWNYNIALEDYSVMQGQAHNIEDLGADHIYRPGLGDDLIADFYQWRQAALQNEGNPYFVSWERSSKAKAAASRAQEATDAMDELQDSTSSNPNFEARSPSERGAAVSGNIAAEFDAGDNPRLNKVSANGRRWAMGAYESPTEGYAIHDDREFAVGTWGIKKNYYQMSPAPTEPPVNNLGFRKVQSVLNAFEVGSKGVAALAVPLFVALAVDLSGKAPEADAMSASVSGFTDFASSLLTSFTGGI